MSRDGSKAKAYAEERGIRKWYDDAHGGFHKMYIVEIENIWEGD